MQAWRSATLLKKRLAQVFSCEFCENFKNTFFAEHIYTTASVVLQKAPLLCIGLGSECAPAMFLTCVKWVKGFFPVEQWFFFSCCCWWFDPLPSFPPICLSFWPPTNFNYFAYVCLQGLIWFVLQPSRYLPAQS